MPASKNNKHKHHVTPKHAGGSNDPSNIVLLTVEEHAEAHRILYEKNGQYGDLVAWQCLSGKTTFTEETRKSLALTALREKVFNNPKRREQWIDKLRAANIGKTDSLKTRGKKSNSIKAAYKNGTKIYVPPKDPTQHSRNCKNNSKLLAAGRKKSEIWRKAVTDPLSARSKQINSPKNKPVIIDNVKYLSIAEAARCLCLDVHVLRQSVRRHGNNIIPNGKIFSRNPNITN